MDPKADVEELLNAGIPFAEQMLREHGEFFPFAVARREDGSVTAVAVSEEEENPAATEVLEKVRHALRHGAEAGEYIATAVFVDVLASLSEDEKTDAVRADLEHQEGYCVAVLFPYERAGDGTVTFGELVVTEHHPVVFDAPLHH